MSFVLLVKPLEFGSNPRILDNKFIIHQLLNPEEYAKEQADAFQLLSHLSQKIRGKGIPTELIDLGNEPTQEHHLYKGKPDAMFPNNSISFHNFTDENAKIVRRLVILYPMSLHRRGELPKHQLVEKLLDLFKKCSEDIQILDLRHFESQNMVLEGTGAMIFSHNGKFVYMCRSERANEKLLSLVCRPEYLNIPPENRFVFDSTLPHLDGSDMGDPVYHTNLIGWCGKGICAWCEEITKFSAKHDQERFQRHLRTDFDKVLFLSPKEIHFFAGNSFELTGNSVGSATPSEFLCLSQTSWDNLSEEHEEVLLSHYGSERILRFNADTVERRTGGSVRCLLCASVTHGSDPASSEPTLLKMAGVSGAVE